MTDEYRKLTSEELQSVYNQLAVHFNPEKNQTHKDICAHVKRYYPKRACSAVLTVHSEYNDSTYDNRAQVLVVYDKDGAEVVPTADTAKESRKLWGGFEVTGETDEAMGDITVHLDNNPMPDLYIKKL